MFVDIAIVAGLLREAGAHVNLLTNGLLLNDAWCEFLKEHRKVEELEASVTQQQKSFQSRFAEQEEKLEALTSSLQRVSAQVELRQTFVSSH